MKILYFYIDQDLAWDSITALLSSSLQIDTPQLVSSERYLDIFSVSVNFRMWGEKIVSDSHKYRMKHFKEENVIFLLFI